MQNSVVFGFLKYLGENKTVKDSLSTKSKSEVLQFASANGFVFKDVDFDDTIWGYEQSLAVRMNEKFDLSFSLWETMWGRNYLDYLVENLAPTLNYDNIQQENLH